MHKLRLGYPCVWQLKGTIEQSGRCCEHCHAPGATLQYHLLQCELTLPLEYWHGKKVMPALVPMGTGEPGGFPVTTLSFNYQALNS